MIAPRSQLDRQRAVSNPYRRILLPPIENTAYPTDMGSAEISGAFIQIRQRAFVV